MSFLIRFILPATVGCSVQLTTNLTLGRTPVDCNGLEEEPCQLVLDTFSVDDLTDEQIDSMIPDDDAGVLFDLAMLDSEPVSVAPTSQMSRPESRDISSMGVVDLSDQEVDARVPDDDPKVLADYTALQLETSMTSDRISEWASAARDYISPLANQAYDYLMTSVAIAKNYASSLMAFAPSTTTPLPPADDGRPTRLRPRRRVIRTTDRPVLRMSQERIAISRSHDAAILSNLMLMYRTVKAKDPARAAELAVRIQQIRGMMKDRLSNQKH